MHLITPPTIEPVDLDEAKARARVSDLTAHDAEIPGLISAAREMAEHRSGRLWCAQTWRVDLADWPAASQVLQVAVATAVAVSYWDGSAWQALDSAAVDWQPVERGVVLAPVAGTAWPALSERAVGARVRVDVTAGLTDAAAIPAAVRLYVLAQVAHWIDNPDCQGAEAPNTGGLLDGVRIWL